MPNAIPTKPITTLFAEWCELCRKLTVGDVAPEDRDVTLLATAELESQIVAAPTHSSLDAFRKVAVVMDGVPAPDDSGNDALLIREAYAALGLPLVPIGSGAELQEAV